MYSRELEKAPDFLIKNGKPLFGSYKTSPKSIGIEGVSRPYGIFPLPSLITNLGIRSHCSLVFEYQDFFGTIDMIDLKLFGFVEVNLWNQNTNQRFSYRGLTGFHRHLIPKNIEKSICSTFNKRRYVRFAWDKKKNRFSLVFHMTGDDTRPNVDGSFMSKYNCKNPTLTSVLPAPTNRRCYSSYQRVFNAKGGIFSSKENETPFFVQQKSNILYTSVKCYYKLRILGSFASGVGKINDKNVVFRLSVMDCINENTDKYNDNALYFDDDLTPLPPVMITHPYGISNKWIIQDTEGMIDLTFTPASVRQRILSIVIANTQYSFIFGRFEGVMVTKDGESITLKDFPGIVKNLRLRI